MKQLLCAVALMVAASAASAQSAPPSETVKQLAPTGVLRAAINYGNSVLAQRGTDGLRGVSVDLSRELAKRLGVDVVLTPFDAAGKAFAAAKENQVDILFVAIEPVRAAEVDFTPPYVFIDGA